MSNVADIIIRTLRLEVQRLAGHPNDRVFLSQQLDTLQAWMDELDRSHEAPIQAPDGETLPCRFT